MKARLYTFIMLLISCATSFAQQQAYYTQYVLNPFVSNPALAGIETYWDVKFSYRDQWQGIEGAPQTTYVTVNGPLKKILNSKHTTGTVPAPVPDSRKKIRSTYAQKYKAITPHGGAGLVFYNDKTGPINRYVIQGSYAYHIGVAPKTSISFGLGGGIQGVRLNTNQLDFGTSNPNDPSVIVNGNVNDIRPDLSAGVWVYSAFYFIGGAAQNLIPVKTMYGQTSAEQVIKPNMMLSAGYKFLLNDQISFLPSTMIKFVNNAPINFDINAKVQYRDILWTGLSYRHSKTLAGMLGINVNSTMNFAYAYDFMASELHNVNRGTHEIVIGLLLGNRNRVLCPRDFW
ncbi:MAG: type IX secretion system membrane protein PorP/SprF [Cytophagia bacterium]|nr:type IX secretion system membrane protein PorP/SprF [Cytophagia bacterium]